MNLCLHDFAVQSLHCSIFLNKYHYLGDLYNQYDNNNQKILPDVTFNFGFVSPIYLIQGECDEKTTKRERNRWCKTYLSQHWWFSQLHTKQYIHYLIRLQSFKEEQDRGVKGNRYCSMFGILTIKYRLNTSHHTMHTKNTKSFNTLGTHKLTKAHCTLNTALLTVH